ncbi:MAG: hypothetical protein QG600_318 [Patescibacteria group bacterium]|jgi:hypothetical protein|nr:hypothetical protein [Patescibacteria group bacterium]
MKNKNVMMIAGGVLLLLVVLGSYFLFTNKSSSPQEPLDESLEENIITLDPEEVGLVLESSANKKQVKFTLSKAEGITMIEYELSYEADNTSSSDDGDGSGRISRGVAGEDELDGTETIYESKFLDLGSCSSGTCRYDTGVSTVNLLLKIVKEDGNVYQVQTSIDL